MTAVNVVAENMLKNFKVFPGKRLVGGADFETYLTVDGAIQFVNRVFSVPTLHEIKEVIQVIVDEPYQNTIMNLIIKIKFLKLKTFTLPDEELPLLKELLSMSSMWCHSKYLEFVNETFYATLEEHYFDNKETMGDGEYLDAMNWLMKHKQLDNAFTKCEMWDTVVVGANISDKTFHIAVWY